MNVAMKSEETRISHSIDMINEFTQVAPHFKWIKLFEDSFKDSEGVGYAALRLRNQILYLEL